MSNHYNINKIDDKLETAHNNIAVYININKLMQRTQTIQTQPQAPTYKHTHIPFKKYRRKDGRTEIDRHILAHSLSAINVIRVKYHELFMFSVFFHLLFMFNFLD